MPVYVYVCVCLCVGLCVCGLVNTGDNLVSKCVCMYVWELLGWGICGWLCVWVYLPVGR